MKYLIPLLLVACEAVNPVAEALIAQRDYDQQQCVQLETPELRLQCVRAVRATSDKQLCAQFPNSKQFCH